MSYQQGFGMPPSNSFQFPPQQNPNQHPNPSPNPNQAPMAMSQFSALQQQQQQQDMITQNVLSQAARAQQRFQYEHTQFQTQPQYGQQQPFQAPAAFQQQQQQQQQPGFPPYYQQQQQQQQPQTQPFFPQPVPNSNFYQYAQQPQFAQQNSSALTPFSQQQQQQQPFLQTQVHQQNPMFLAQQQAQFPQQQLAGAVLGPPQLVVDTNQANLAAAAAAAATLNPYALQSPLAATFKEFSSKFC